MWLPSVSSTLKVAGGIADGTIFPTCLSARFEKLAMIDISRGLYIAGREKADFEVVRCARMAVSKNERDALEAIKTQVVAELDIFLRVHAVMERFGLALMTRNGLGRHPHETVTARGRREVRIRVFILHSISLYLGTS